MSTTPSGPPAGPPAGAPDYRVVRTTAAGEEIRKFADANVSAAIDRAIASANLAPHKHVAIVAAANLEGASGAVMVRMGDDWSYVGTVSRTWKGELKAEAAVKWSH